MKPKDTDTNQPRNYSFSKEVDDLTNDISSLNLDLNLKPNESNNVSCVKNLQEKLSTLAIFEDKNKNERVQLKIKTEPSNALEDKESKLSDSESDYEEDALQRGPDKSKYFNHSHIPYTRHFTPNISPSPNNSFSNLEVAVGYQANIPVVNFIPCQQKLLCGGGQIAEENIRNPEIDNIKDRLKSEEVLPENSLQFLDSFSIADLDEDGFQNTILDLEFDLNLNFDQYLNSPTNEILDANSSPFTNTSSEVSNFSPCSSDQEVYSPSTSTSTPSFYYTETTPSPTNDNSIEFSSFQEIKYKKIMPKYQALNKINTINLDLVTQKAKKGNKIGPRNKYHSKIPKPLRDSYHRRMFKLKNIGFGIKSEDGFTFLHTLIAKKVPDFAICFIYILKLWKEKNPEHEGLKDIEDIDSFINSRDVKGRTAIYLSSMLNQPDITGYLFEECNANIQIACNDGLTPLHIACQRGENFYNIVDIFCKEPWKINLDVTNHEGKTALHEAVNCHKLLHVHGDDKEEINSISIVKLLLKAGAKIDIQDNNGCTPIHLAVKQRHIDILSILYDYGGSLSCNFEAAVNMIDNDNYTPIDIAHIKMYDQIFHKLLTYGGKSSKEVN